jgi:hypothetical protein
MLPSFVGSRQKLARAHHNPNCGNPAESIQCGQSETELRCGGSSPKDCRRHWSYPTLNLDQVKFQIAPDRMGSASKSIKTDSLIFWIE